MKSNKFLPLLAMFVILLFSGCDSVFDIHPYDTRITGETNLNAKNIAKIQTACLDKDTMRIAVISDSHQWYSDLTNEVSDINRRDSIDFVIHLGDLTDFGSTQEYNLARERLQKLRAPFVVLQGNHDCLGTGNEVFEKMFGDNDFSFIAGRVKFVMLNTNAIEYDYSEPVPDFDFMENETTKDSALFDRTVVCMHAAPYSEQFNNNVLKPFNYYMQLYPGLMFCLYGHGHQIAENDFFDNGTVYYEVAAACKRKYRIITIIPDGYQNEVVSF